VVSVDSPWWQWHLNGSRLSFLCLCRNILLIRSGGEFSFIVCGMWHLLCCDLYEQIKMVALYIYIYIYIYIYRVTLFLLLVGGKKRITIYIYIYYIYIKAPIFISLYKSQQSIGNLNDYRLNAIATTANLQ